MPQFIGRPNLPSALANKLVQLAAMQNDPIAAGIKSAAGSIAGGMKTKQAKEEAIKLREEQKADKEREKAQNNLVDLQRKQEDIYLEYRRRGIDLDKAMIPKDNIKPGQEGPTLPQGLAEQLGKDFATNPVQNRQEYMDFLSRLPVYKPETTPAQDLKLKTDTAMAPIKIETAKIELKNLKSSMGGGGDKNLAKWIADMKRVRASEETEEDPVKLKALSLQKQSLAEKLEQGGFPMRDFKFKKDVEQAYRLMNTMDNNGKPVLSAKEAIKQLSERYENFDPAIINDEVEGSSGFDWMMEFVTGKSMIGGK